MQAACEANPGAMLAVMGVDGDELVKVADAAGCHVANFNSLAQTVLSGTAESIDAAEGLVKEAGAKRAIRLPVAGAFHSPLMQPAADKMTDFLAEINFSSEKVTVLSNVTAKLHEPGSVKADMVKTDYLFCTVGFYYPVDGCQRRGRNCGVRSRQGFGGSHKAY